MIATALGELNCPSLEYVNNMTWAEFQIRLFSYRRRDKQNWDKVKELMISIVQSGFLDAKDKKNIITKLSGNRNNITQANRLALLEAQRLHNGRVKS